MEISITKGIKISVQSVYMPLESLPAQNSFYHAYKITIENLSQDTVQLLRRHWFISDSNGIKREVEGEGVIGQQPILNPGDSHAYSSWCPLMTDIGKMHGTFLMKKVTDDRLFKVTVPEFKLIPPFKTN
jgi:ApaG protein